MSKHIATSRKWLTSQLEALLRSYEIDLAILSKRDRGRRAVAAAIVDDLMVRAGESTQAVVGELPFFREPSRALDAEATAWANAGRSDDWETIVDDMGSGDGNGVRRVAVPGGWLYQVAIWDLTVARSTNVEDAKATHSHRWSTPVFVADEDA